MNKILSALNAMNLAATILITPAFAAAPEYVRIHMKTDVAKPAKEMLAGISKIAEAQ